MWIQKKKSKSNSGDDKCYYIPIRLQMKQTFDLEDELNIRRQRCINLWSAFSVSKIVAHVLALYPFAAVQVKGADVPCRLHVKVLEFIQRQPVVVIYINNTTTPHFCLCKRRYSHTPPVLPQFRSGNTELR